MRAISKVLSALILLTVCSWAFAGTVNINTADAKTLASELNGVGPSKAQAIVKYRKEHGPFKTANDLLAVKGIGDHLLKNNANRIVVKGK